MIKIKNVYYPVKDMKQTCEFYSETLGLQLKFIDGDNWAQFNVSGYTIALAGPKESPEGIEKGAVVTLSVDDLEAVREKLLNKGVFISEIRDMGSHGKTCWLKDPEGNIIQLHQ